MQDIALSAALLRTANAVHLLRIRAILRWASAMLTTRVIKREDIIESTWQLGTLDSYW